MDDVTADGGGPSRKRSKTLEPYEEFYQDRELVLLKAASLVRTLYAAEAFARWGVKVDETDGKVQFASDGDASRLVRSFSAATAHGDPGVVAKVV